MAVEMALCKPGDTVMGMKLSHGGHLTHGSPVNFSGQYFNIVGYGVNEQGYIDYDEVERLAMEHKPKLIICGASAYPRVIDFKRFREIADKCGAFLMSDIAHIAGLVWRASTPAPSPGWMWPPPPPTRPSGAPRGGLILSTAEFAEAHKLNKWVFPGTQGGPLMHIIAAKAVAFKEALDPSFIEYQKLVLANSHALADALQARGFNLVSGGTDNHLMLVDLRNKGINGEECEELMDSANITCNKNSIPYGHRRSQPPQRHPSGHRRRVRPGPPARGHGDHRRVHRHLVSPAGGRREGGPAKVAEITIKYPLYWDR